MPVNTTNAQYNAHITQWKRCRDVICGQDAVHLAGESYLPKLKDQLPEEYRAYVERATFYNATWRTISGLVGMILRKEPHVEVPPQVTPLLEDVSANGTPFTLFLKNVCNEVLGLGRVGILVDYPSVDTSNMTLADVQAQKLQPMMHLYRAEAIINWKCERTASSYRTTLVVLRESADQPVDEYEAKQVTQYRVLDLVAGRYRVRVFREADGGSFLQVGTDIFPMMNGAPLNYIPFVPISPDGTTMDADDPPLIDLVNLNLSHYRTTADYEHAAHFVGLPTPVIAGFRPDDPSTKIYIGGSAAIILPDPAAKATFLEFTGQGLQALQNMLKDKELQMAVLGARMLEPQTKAKESPEAQSIRRKGEESMLSIMAIVIGLGMTVALKWFTEWAGADSSDVDCELNKDFYPVPMDGPMLLALVQTWQAGAISDQVLFDNLQAGEIIAEDMDLETMQAQGSSAPPVGGAPAPEPAPTEGA